VHNREPGYLPDPEYHAYRDANIDNYVPAIEYLLGKGYYVIRLGDKTMKPLPPISDRLIDSPFHPMYSQFIELYFVSQSKFMLCAPSGPYGISWTFDVPTLLVNRPVHAGCYMNDHNLMVPKKYYSHILKRHLTYTEIITSPLPDFYQTKLFEEFGVELHENTPDEILRAVQEMDQRLDRQYPLDGPAQTLHRRIKQVQFRGECYRQHACPRFPHYSLYWSKAQLSHEFVKLNPYFLEDGLWLPQESPPQADNAQPQDTCDSASLTYSN
jgi:putative glycosyltransferase (TIGR04372 family)